MTDLVVIECAGEPKVRIRAYGRVWMMALGYADVASHDTLAVEQAASELRGRLREQHGLDSVRSMDVVLWVNGRPSSQDVSNLYPRVTRS